MGTNEMAQDFVEKVRHLHEIEYGDFKRKLGLYLNRMEQDLGDAPLEIRDLIKELREKVVFDPSGDIETTRLRVIELGQRIAQLSRH